MRKFFLAPALAALLFASSCLAALEPIAIVVNINDVSQEMLEYFRNGSADNVALEISAGTQLPLHFFISGDVFNVDEDSDASPLILNIMQTFYVRRAGEDLLFSKDLVIWDQFTEVFSGNFGILLDASTGTPSLNILGEAHLN